MRRLALVCRHVEKVEPAPKVRQRRIGRARPSHALRNDALLSAAATTTIATLGWDSTTIAHVADAAGLTHGAIYGRYIDKGELGAAHWTTTLLPALQEALHASIAAGMRSDGAEAFTEAMLRFVAPAPPLIAAVEMILAAPFEAIIGPGILADAQTLLAAWSEPSADLDATTATQAAAIVYFAFGLTLASYGPWLSEADMEPALRQLHQAVSAPTPIVTLPESPERYFSKTRLTADDPRLEALLNATVDLIGTLGYRGASVARICRAAGVSQGFLFDRFATKLDLLITTLEPLQQEAVRITDALGAQMRATYGPSIAEAVTWREHQLPEYQPSRLFSLEFVRLSRFNERVREQLGGTVATAVEERIAAAAGSSRPELIGFTHRDYAVSLGLIAVGNILPNAWKLPFNCITDVLVAGDPQGLAIRS